MRYAFIALTSALALAACSQQAEAPAEEEAPVEEVAAAATAAGIYDYATEDGSSSGRIVMNEDGTYVDNEEGQEETTGTWTSADGQTCFTDSAEGSETNCFTDEAPGEDGSWKSTGPDGTVFTVTPVSEEAA